MATASRKVESDRTFRTNARNGALASLAPLRERALELFRFLGLHPVGVLCVRKRACAHFARVLLKCGDRDVGDLRVALGELRLELVEHAEKVECEQQLSARRRSR